MTPDGATDGRGLAFLEPDAPPFPQVPPARHDPSSTRLAAARAAMGAARDPEALTRTPLCEGASRLDQALGGGLARAGLHEIAPREAGDRAAAFGFSLALAIRLAQGRPILWVGDEATFGETGALYAPGIEAFGAPSRRVFAVRANGAREAFWALEEAVKSGAVGAAIGEIGRVGGAYDLIVSRRLTLAAREGGTPCLLSLSGLAGQAETLSSAAATRFEIAAAPSSRPAAGGRSPLPSLLPWPGGPVWEARLAKRKGGGAAGFETVGTVFRLAWACETGALRDHDEAASQSRLAASGG